MRRSLGIFGAAAAILVALGGLAGCALAAGGVGGPAAKGLGSPAPASSADFEHIIGHWKGTFIPADPFGSPFSDEFVFSRDGTYTEVADFPPLLTDSGTVELDPGTKTMTARVTYSSDESILPIGFVMTFGYSFSTNHKVLTVSDAAMGTGVYTEQ